jgi:hypothetical protein
MAHAAFSGKQHQILGVISMTYRYENTRQRDRRDRARDRRERIAAQRQDAAYIEKKARLGKLRGKIFWSSVAAVISSFWSAQLVVWGLSSFGVNSGLGAPFFLIAALYFTISSGVATGMLITARRMSE